MEKEKFNIRSLTQSLEVHLMLQSVATQIFIRQNTELVRLVTKYKERIRKLEDQLAYISEKEDAFKKKGVSYETGKLDDMDNVIKSQEMEIVAMRREIKYLSRKAPVTKQKKAQRTKVVSFK
ncbi:uncharacterized protein LOC136039100 [Artemia franciscana]|uniref:Uncharacterized protein n=1 Tax=Artemia franciscana TaxID=6661 RepID=A0AA88LKW6_ARTSF|nr:hypothetical protein QYM36_008104 [Artemia franciscana]